MENPKEYITCMCLVSVFFIIYVGGMYIKDNSYNVSIRYICLIIKYKFSFSLKNCFCYIKCLS